MPPEKLKVWAATIKEGKKGIPFVTVRVEDNALVTDLERVGICAHKDKEKEAEERSSRERPI